DLHHPPGPRARHAGHPSRSAGARRGPQRGQHPQGRGRVKYVSTRGRAPVLGFGDVLLTGLARDGGLYVPERWPDLAPPPRGERSYVETAVEVMAPFVEGSIDLDAFAAIVADAYSTFSHRDVTPLVPLE